MQKLASKKLIKMRGGVSVEAVMAVLRDFDRLKDNPYFPDRGFVEEILERYGYLTFMVFVCPKMQSRYLDTTSKEKFMPVEEPRNGLIFPRLPKLRELTTKLWEFSVPSKIIFVVGDNDFEVYKGPVLGISLNSAKTDERRSLYLANLSAALFKIFPQFIEVISLGLMQIGAFVGDLSVPEEMMQREIASQKWVFEKYYPNKMTSEKALREIAALKIRAYAEQGFLIEAADAILIGTEGSDPDSWLQRTQMFCIGGASFKAIYPYIRMGV